MKKPRLNPLEFDATAAAPPRTLAEPGRTLWSSIADQFDLANPMIKAELTAICEGQDRLCELKQRIDAEGLTIEAKNGQLRENPLLKLELQQRSYLTRALARLGVYAEIPDKVGRPARGFGWQPVKLK